MQLNAFELRKYMGKTWKNSKLEKVLFMQILTIVHWSGILVLVNLSEKLRKSKCIAWK